MNNKTDIKLFQLIHPYLSPFHHAFIEPATLKKNVEKFLQKATENYQLTSSQDSFVTP
jgi:hypothetical protein